MLRVKNCADSSRMVGGRNVFEEVVESQKGWAVLTSACLRYTEVKYVKVPYGAVDGCVAHTFTRELQQSSSDSGFQNESALETLIFSSITYISKSILSY